MLLHCHAEIKIYLINVMNFVEGMDTEMRNLIQVSVDKTFEEVTVQLQATISQLGDVNRTRSPAEMFAKLR